MEARPKAFFERKANTNANILSYLKKRAEMTADFADEKVQSALSKISVKKIDFSKTDSAPLEGFDCVVSNKMFRNWLDLIPEKDRSFVRFVYEDGKDKSPEKYIRTAMTAPAFGNFQSEVSNDASEDDLFLMRRLIWDAVVLKRPVGFDFDNYEMNAIFNALPLDISKNKIKFGRKISFVEFYRMIWFAKQGLEIAD
jgi:uncharacterized protein YehS (DUF1456 family)